MTPSQTDSRTSHRLFPESQRVYVAGSRPDLRVPMREIPLSPTRASDGRETANEPVRVYDTSGPWGDAEFHADVTRGLPRLRQTWIQRRGDVETYEGREVRPEDDGYLSIAHVQHAAERNGRNRLVQYPGHSRNVL